MGGVGGGGDCVDCGAGCNCRSFKKQEKETQKSKYRGVSVRRWERKGVGWGGVGGGGILFKCCFVCG